MPKKPASGRAYEHVTFSAGMVSVPLSVFTGTDSSHGVKRGMFTTISVLDDQGNQVMAEVEKGDGTKEEVPVTEDHPVGYGNIDKETGELVPPGQPVVKKIATEYGHVHVEDHEIEKLFELSPKTITVKEFQPINLFYQGHYVPKSLYYVEVSKTKVGSKKVENLTAQKNFALVLAAMRSQNAMAVVEFTTRGVPKPAILLPNGTLWCIYHHDELREQRPLPEVEIPLEIAKQAWNQYFAPLWGEQPLDLTDDRSALIQNFADEKARAGDFGKSTEVAEPEVAQVDSNDLMAMLAASVEAASKAS